MRGTDDWSLAEDGRRARHGFPTTMLGGAGRFWVLSVNLWQGKAWPVDCTVRLTIRESNDASLSTELGRYWPEQSTEEDGA